jgi:arsenate reductase (thioredoxin)
MGAMPQALDPVTQHHIDQAADRLADEFADVFSRETIARYMAESQDLLGEARINVFVPVLAHRFTRERLKALAQAEGRLVKEQPEVLFVCMHNAGRSQMAAVGVAKRYFHAVVTSALPQRRPSVRVAVLSSAA